MTVLLDLTMIVLLEVCAIRFAMYVVMYTGFGEVSSEAKHNPITESVSMISALAWAPHWSYLSCLSVIEQGIVHPSLSAPMTYIFHDGEHWINLRDWFVYNTLSQLQ